MGLCPRFLFPVPGRTRRAAPGHLHVGEQDLDVGMVLVAIERRVLGRCTADQFSEDLAVEGVGLGRCGFALDLPAGLLSVRRGYAISVRREGDGVHLPGSPYVLEPAIRVVQ